MIIKTPGTCGGAARINGTRITVRALHACRLGGWGDAKILHNYPMLTEPQISEAWAYVDAHPEEFQDQAADGGPP